MAEAGGRLRAVWTVGQEAQALVLVLPVVSSPRESFGSQFPNL